MYMYIYIYNLWFPVTMREVLELASYGQWSSTVIIFSVFSSCVCLVLFEVLGSNTKNHCLKS